ncbi:DUF6571 family protein [Streptomyces abyssomicinicus]|uniref:DUF6571 family protein n=1 Tax=Streptomyces abyssomicinicus TaxID=574929 RepID=UPI00124FD646|nr:DUF6571 family protein [Streptomyces abyssomicinicus]
MDLSALRFANFATLDEAVEEWRLVAKNLETLAKDAEDGLRGAANKANWAGENSQVTKEFIGKTAGEFQDAHTQATTIHNILKDTTGELKSYQRQLTEALDRGLKKNLTVMDTGEGGFTVTMNIHPDRAAKGHTPPEHDASDVTALRDEVQGILSKATESDDSARKVLTAIADQSAMGFSDASYADRDAAADAVRDAEELAKLAKQKPEDLSPEEFDRLNAGLKEHANDPLFAETFATTLGPQGVLEFWAGINDPHAGARIGHERVEQYGELQKNLSLTLAAATQSDSASMSDWQTKMIALGDKPVGRDGYGPMGFQVMSNLMRAGDFDDSFLTRYGNSLMQTERQLTGNGEHANMAWSRMGMDPWLNRMGEDSGDDPLTGYLKALSNSPDAATNFFNQEYINKNDEDNPFERDTDNNDKKGKVTLSNFQYLFEEREWPKEYGLDGDELHTGRNTLGLALEAATTGHPAGELPTADTPAHNAEQARLFEAVVGSVSDNPKLLTDNGFMSDSFGQMASEYLPDINRSMTDVDLDSTDEQDRDAQQRIKNLFPVAGEDARMEHHEVSRFLLTVGQNPEGYAAVDVAQKAYVANLMDYHLDPSLPVEQRYLPDDMERTVEEIAHSAGEVGGALAVGRQEGIAGDAAEADKKYEESVQQRKDLVSAGVGTVVGAGTSLIASPIAGAVVGGAADAASGALIDAVFGEGKGSELDDAAGQINESWETSEDHTKEYVRRAAEQAAKEHGHEDAGDLAEAARAGVRQGFTTGGAYCDSVAAELRTDR